MADIYRNFFKQVHVMLLGALLFTASEAADSNTSLMSQQRPAETLCRGSLSWHVNDIDPQFGLSHSEVTSAVRKAINMWNQAAGAELFEAAESADTSNSIEINLVFDHRQGLRDYVTQTDTQINHLSEQINDLDAQLADERLKMERDSESIEAMSARIEHKRESLDEMIVRHANQRGQVSRQVAQQMNELQAQAQQLIDTHNTKVVQFQRRQTSFNNKVRMRNQVMEQRNTLAMQRNQTVQSRETEWQRRGLGIEAGNHNIHIRSSNDGVLVLDERITVYTASEHLGLTTLLAHEFGHVIGINHVQGATSIMSARQENMTSGAHPQQLSRQDIEALRLVCQQRL